MFVLLFALLKTLVRPGLPATVARGHISPVLCLFPETPLTILTHYPPHAPILPGVSMTAFVGSHARRDALQLIQAFWEALGMSTSVSKTGNTSSQRSCTVVPSPPSKGGCVSCPPDTICCLFMVVSRSVKHVVTCLLCVSFCVRNNIQPFGKCPFCSSPGSELPCLPLPAHGGCSTD